MRKLYWLLLGIARIDGLRRSNLQFQQVAHGPAAAVLPAHNEHGLLPRLVGQLLVLRLLLERQAVDQCAHASWKFRE